MLKCQDFLRKPNQKVSIKEEFSLKKLGLCGEDLLQFTTSQWIKSPMMFRIYRLIFVVYWIIAPVLSFKVAGNKKIYTNDEMMGNARTKLETTLTGWCFVVLEADFGLALLLCLVAYSSCVKNCRCCDLLKQLSWLLTNINSSMAVFVTIVYFGTVYDKSGETSSIDLHVHGLTTVFVIVDNVVSARPRRLLHFIYPLGFVASYFIFSVIFWSVDHENNVNYKVILDWNNPGPAIGCSIGFGLLIVIIHAALFFLYKINVCLHSKAFERYCSSETPERDEGEGLEMIDQRN